MADLGQSNLNFQPNAALLDSMANIAQRKAQLDQQNALQGQQMQTMQQERTMQTIKMASEITQGLIQYSANQQQKTAQGHVADILGQSNQPTEFSPTGTPVQAKSSLFPGMTQATTAAPSQTYGGTPEYKAKLSEAVMRANPEAYTKALAESLTKAQTPQPLALQHMFAIVGAGEKAVPVAFDPKTNNYYDQQGNKITEPISAPPSSMNQMVEVTEKDRQNPALRNAAHAYANGDALPSQLFNQRTAAGQKALMMALEENPSFNTTDWQVKSEMKKDYTTKGNAGRNLVANNTAINHLDRLFTTGEEMSNSDILLWNKVKNTALKQTGNSKIDKMLADRDAVDSELGRAFQGTGAVTQAERDSFKERLSKSSSPQQIKDVSEEYIKLLAGRIDPLKEAWNTKLSGQSPAVPFTTKQSAAVLKKHGFDPDTLKPVEVKGGGSSGVPQVGQMFNGGKVLKVTKVK